MIDGNVKTFFQRVIDGDPEARREFLAAAVRSFGDEDKGKMALPLPEPTATTVPRLMQSGVPKRVASFALSQCFDVRRESWVNAERWLAAIKRGHTRTVLVLQGTHGNGKSVAAARALSLQSADEERPRNIPANFD